MQNGRKTSGAVGLICTKSHIISAFSITFSQYERNLVGFRWASYWSMLLASGLAWRDSLHRKQRKRTFAGPHSFLAGDHVRCIASIYEDKATKSANPVCAAGTVTLSDAWGTALDPAPVSPTTDSAAFKLMSGTIRAAWAGHHDRAEDIVVSPGMMSGNTGASSSESIHITS